MSITLENALNNPRPDNPRSWSLPALAALALVLGAIIVALLFAPTGGCSMPDPKERQRAQGIVHGLSVAPLAADGTAQTITLTIHDNGGKPPATVQFPITHARLRVGAAPRPVILAHGLSARDCAAVNGVIRGGVLEEAPRAPAADALPAVPGAMPMGCTVLDGEPVAYRILTAAMPH